MTCFQLRWHLMSTNWPTSCSHIPSTIRRGWWKALPTTCDGGSTRSPRPAICPIRRVSKYTDSYQTTGAFLAWAVKTYDKDLVPSFNKVLRAGAYKTEIFKEATGKDVDELWKEFKETFPAEEESQVEITQPTGRAASP